MLSEFSSPFQACAEMYRYQQSHQQTLSVLVDISPHIYLQSTNKLYRLIVNRFGYIILYIDSNQDICMLDAM
jgi:hypothetical protein